MKPTSSVSETTAETKEKTSKSNRKGEKGSIDGRSTASKSTKPQGETQTSRKGQGNPKPGKGGAGHKGAHSSGEPKETKSTKPKRHATDAEINKKEDIFQAVLLADNFSSSIFGPDSPIRQEGLLSLANKKLIDYTLEALTVSGVQEIFVYCTCEVEEIRDYLKESSWSSIPNCTISVIMSEDCLSLGDAMRDLDGKGVIKNDFILLSAGVVTNLPLKTVLNLHRDTLKQDKGAVLTLVQRVMHSNHRSRPKHQNTAIVVNSTTHKVITYDPAPSGKKLHIPLGSVMDEMDIYMDSIDTGIVVCSASVPALFTDNFDFSCMDDFIKGTLINEEILGNSVYLHRFDSGYASRVVDFDTFHGISCDILQRWTYPVVPDMPFGTDLNDNNYNLHQNFIYKAANVKTAYGSELQKSVIIGANSVISNGTKICNSVLGANCTIQSDVSIMDSHIGNNVEIGENCRLTRCIVMDGTVLKTTTPQNDKLIIGDRIFSVELPVQRIEDSDLEDDSDIEVDDFADGENAEFGTLQDEDFKIFSLEVTQSLLRAFRQTVAIENLVLEINSSKFAYNMTFKEVTVAVTKGILNIAPKVYPEFHDTVSPKVQWEKVKEVLMKLKFILVHYVTTEDSRMDLIQALEEYANYNIYLRPMMIKVLHSLYDEDILSEEAILRWHKSPSLFEVGPALRISVKQLIDWLEASDSDSDEE